MGVIGRRWRSGARRQRQQQREGGGEEGVEARCSSRARVEDQGVRIMGSYRGISMGPAELFDGSDGWCRVGE